MPRFFDARTAFRRLMLLSGDRLHWRPADRDCLGSFLRIVNTGIYSDTMPVEITVRPKQREIAVSVGELDYRVIVRPGVTVMERGRISAADVERFEFRRVRFRPRPPMQEAQPHR